MNGVLLPWAIAAGLITARDVKVYHRPPVPSEFVYSGMFFAGLAALAGMGEGQARVSALLGWGILAAIALQVWGGGGQLTGKPVGQTTAGAQRPGGGQP